MTLLDGLFKLGVWKFCQVHFTVDIAVLKWEWILSCEIFTQGLKVVKNLSVYFV